MPFKFRLRRARHYNVSTKNSYVICVHLLDKTLKECTLSTDSLGQECLDNIAQRIDLADTMLFGLRYMNKKLEYRWVELDKPLRRQLDKYANSPMLYCGVMFYVAGTACLSDDSVRYQYYLQLKTDVIDGKLPCTEEQAVRLASYSIQAEFGDHDPAQHTPDFLKDLVLLPRNMTLDESVLGQLTAAVVASHRQLSGHTAAAAERQYIVEAQQLSGYGLEYYPAKDDAGNELLLGSSFVGIFVINNSQPAQYFKWSDINNLLHNKRVFGIETSLSEQTVNYVTESPDMAKYVFKMCTLQHKFYMDNKHVLQPDKHMTTLKEGSTGPLSDLQQTVALAMAADQAHNPVPCPPPTAHSDTAGQTVISPEEYYVKAHAYVDQTDIQYANGSVFHVPQNIPQDIQYHAPSQQVYQQQAQQQAQQQQQQQQAQKQAHQQAQQQQQPVASFPANGHLTPSVLPSYRPSPDYDAVMRGRMERLAQRNLDQVNNVANISHAQVYANPEMMAYSQPEMGGGGTYTTGPFAVGHPSDRPYGIYGVDVHQGHVTGQYRPVDRSASLIIHPTYSTPELTSQGLSNQLSTSENVMSEALLAQYKPPPPYPRPSSSTPDLASTVQNRRGPLNGSPDLVSRRNLNNAPLVHQSRLDQSMENLVLGSGGDTVGEDTVDMSAMRTPMMDQLLSAQHNLGTLYSDAGGTPGENIYVNTAGSGDYANVSAIIASESGANQHYLHYDEKLGVQEYPAYSTPSNVLPYAPGIDNAMFDHALLGNDRGRPGSDRGMMVSDRGRPGSDRGTPGSDPGRAGSDRSTPGSDRGLSSSDWCSAGGEHVTRPNSDQARLGSGRSVASSDRGGVGSRMGSERGCITSRQYISHHHTSSLDSSISHDSSRLFVQDSDPEEDRTTKRLSMGPLKMAAMNGLSISRASVLDPTPYENRAPKDERRKILETKLEEGQVFQEFEHVPKKAAKCHCSVAGAPENQTRNRFKDVHPYDHNRAQIAPTRDNPGGYINASHIKMTMKEHTWRFVATQGPLANTVRDFWALVWEQGVDVIAMLTAIVEQGRPKCHQYWPDKQGPKHTTKYGEWDVYLRFSNDSGGYVTRGLHIRHTPSGNERLVWQLQYTDWPDHGCPQNTDGFLTYLDEIESVHRHVMSERADAPASPVLVHCSAGVGRAGVVILADIMKTCLEHNVNVDVPTVLGHLRAQRMHMVQTVGQYSFVYKVLVHFLNNTRLI